MLKIGHNAIAILTILLYNQSNCVSWSALNGWSDHRWGKPAPVLILFSMHLISH
jgi:hypothetical protein